MGETPLYVAAGISILGLLILAYVSETLEPPVSEIGQITTNDLGKNVHIRGIVTDVHEFKGGSKPLMVDDATGSVEVYLPYSTATGIDGEPKDSIDVLGTVQVYRGKLEIVVDDPENLR